MITNQRASTQIAKGLLQIIWVERQLEIVLSTQITWKYQAFALRMGESDMLQGQHYQSQRCQYNQHYHRKQDGECGLAAA